MMHVVRFTEKRLRSITTPAIQNRLRNLRDIRQALLASGQPVSGSNPVWNSRTGTYERSGQRQ